MRRINNRTKLGSQPGWRESSYEGGLCGTRLEPCTPAADEREAHPHYDGTPGGRKECASSTRSLSVQNFTFLTELHPIAYSEFYTVKLSFVSLKPR